MKTGLSPKIAALFSLAIAFGITPLSAQGGLTVGQVVTTYTPHFFIAVIGGVILAMGFQILLTSLSVASGISLVGNVEKKFGGSAGEEDEKEAEADEEEGGASPIVKISNAIGVWTVVTVSISLFFASLLAVRLTLVGTVWMGITLGLIIWAAFFATMAYLEIRSASTLIGGVLSAAFSGMRASFATARNVFSDSPEKKITKSVSEAASAVRSELMEGFDQAGVMEKLDEYVNRLQPQPIDFDQIKADLTEILSSVRLEEKAEITEGYLDRQTFIRLAQKERPHLKKQDLDRLGELYGDVRSTLSKEGRGSEKVEELARKLTADKADVTKYQEKVEDYLRRTGREEIDPERIKQDIDRIFEDPKSTREVLLNRLHSINQDTLVAALAQREGVSEEKARKLVDTVQAAIDWVRQKVTGMEEGTSAAGSKVASLPKKVEERIRQALGSVGRPEFDYDRIRLDFERMLHDPKASPKILHARWKLYNRDSLKALLSSREDISEEDAERMISKVEEARDNVLQRAEELEDQVRYRLREAKKKALHEAENVRKASAAAAWWMVGTAVVSGAFSAFGAALAITL